MKSVKIILAIVVIGLISFFVIQSLEGSPDIEKVSPPNNPFTHKIEVEIDKLRKHNKMKFYRANYDTLKYYIEDYHKDQLLGKDKYENDQWKDILSKNLYSVYTTKFIKQTYYVFNRNDWSTSDLDFIRNESATLRKSGFLEKGSLVDNSISEIQQILSKYDEINAFITSCKGFSYTDYSFNSSFPISDVKQKIVRINFYKNNGLGNNYVNNCARLDREMKGIKQLFFNAHYEYLENKYKKWQDLYTQYNSFNEYRTSLFIPLKQELDLMNYDIYNVNNFENKLSNLENLLQSDSRNAFNHFNK